MAGPEPVYTKAVTTTLPTTGVTISSVGSTFTESGTTVTAAMGSNSTVTITYDSNVVSVSAAVVGNIPTGTSLPTSYSLDFGAVTISAVGSGSTALKFTPSNTSYLEVSVPITVSGGASEDESYLNKRGLAHFWENIDDIKQDKLTAGTGISISNNVISATGGGEADSVAWGHITGTLANQTDLNTALGAKANTADLATVATSGSYNDLTNKPTIPTVNDATLTIQKNGTNVQTFTANATSNKTANITVPTKTSDLTNDSGFLDSVAWGDVTGKPTFATVATSGSYNDLTNKPTIPAAVTVDSALSDSSTNPVQNQVITNALDLKANAADVSTALAGKQATLTAGSHISLSGSTISAVDYVHSDDPVSTQSVTQTVTNSMIATGTITADKFATGATLKLTMSTSDIGEGAALAANTLYGVYE